MTTFEKPSEEYLAHYGVLGMKWGVRRTQAQLDRAAGRKADRAAAKEIRRETKANRDKAILSSRDRQQRASTKLDRAKVQYQKDKMDKGRSQARAILNRAKEDFNQTMLREENVAFQATSKEATESVLFAVGGVALTAAALAFTLRG